MPWKNGMGSTVELLKQNLLGRDEFAWRLSIADVTIDGEFSNFSGYERILLLLEGNGVTLEFNNKQQSADLIDRLHCAQFRGEDRTIASLHDGPIKDFNIMTLRSHCWSNVIAHNNSSTRNIDVICDVLLVYAVENLLTIVTENQKPIHVPHRSLLRIDKPDSQRLILSGAPFIAIQFVYRNSGGCAEK